ncbi:MAG: helix-turn-helix transcriptional regulator [Myxococcales bacterium]|nr:helix-turn-helix transcriptional regulator [Myxococcales bacterium]
MSTRPPLMVGFVRVPSLDAFFGEPARRYVVFRSFLYWQAERRAFGTMIWGRPDERDIDEMCAAHEVGASDLFRGHTSLVDLRALQSVDVLAFNRLLAYLVSRREAWSPNVSRQAVLHRSEVAHAAIVGMLEFLRPGHPIAYFSTPSDAYEAIGAADLQPELEALRDHVLGVPDVVRRVRTAFDDLPKPATPERVARALGTSTRSLQRRLSACGTSLTIERQLHWVRAIEALLQGTDLDLDAIALQVGATSPSHVVTLFKTHRGITPGEFRARRRARPSV